ncbi:hypothetical protein, partial [Enterobacter hormaechei]
CGLRGPPRAPSARRPRKTTLHYLFFYCHFNQLIKLHWCGIVGAKNNTGDQPPAQLVCFIKIKLQTFKTFFY